ncbi:MAG: HEAT repeat domain-containing protein, partial [Opitutaceae bacterium]|nr:HEAT repeat domain-containing protein [Opitutaceae bacterium]
ALEQRLFDVLRRSESTFAARQAAAQRLGWILGLGAPKADGGAYKPLGAMLADERDSDLARVALEAAPGAAVDGLFIDALEKTTGRTRLGLLDSLARRRQASAVPALTKLLADPDEPTAAAAARALGEIADSAALAALQARAEPSPAPIAAAKLAAARRLPAATALPLLNDLQRTARDPVHRAAALRLTLDLEPAAATERIVDVLAGTNGNLKAVALEAIAAARAPGLVATLAQRLGDFDAPTQRAVIAALERRADGAAAQAAIVKAVRHADADVRAAAIHALGTLPGSPDTVALLVQLAKGEGEDARTARQSLARLKGAGVSASILAGAETGDPANRAVFIEQLALRNMTEGLPLLLKLRIDPSPVVRAAAVGALGDLAPATEQKALLDWAIEATDSNEQTRALRALVTVTLRNPNIEERGRPIHALIEFALPDLALRLLPALTRIGGAASAECAAKLAVRDDARLAEAATAALARWTDDTALVALATVAEKAAQAPARTAAIDAVLRHFERQRDGWDAASTGVTGRLLASTQDADTRAKLVRLLHRARDRAALEVLASVKSDPALAAAAATAEAVVQANLAGSPRARSSRPAGLSNLFDGKTGTRWNTPVLGEEWIEVDFRQTRPLSRVILDQTGRGTEFPERYEVHVTDDPKQPGPALVTGAGQRNQTVIDLPANTRGRYLIIKNTAPRADSQWSVCELYVE